MWLENHNYFYICATQEFCWNKWYLKPGRWHLIVIRTLLFLIMLALIGVEIPIEASFRWKYLTNWGVYITFISTVLNLMCAIRQL